MTTSSNPGAGRKGGEIVHPGVMGQDDLGHHGHVTPHDYIRGEVRMSEQHSSRAHLTRFAHGSGWVDDRCVSIIAQVQAVGDDAAADVVIRPAGGNSYGGIWIVVDQLNWPEDRQSSDYLAVQLGVVIEEALERPNWLVRVYGTYGFRGLASEAA